MVFVDEGSGLKRKHHASASFDVSGLRRWAPAIGMLVILLGAAGSARGQISGVFPKGTWTLSGYGAYAHSFDGEPESIGSATAGVGYYIFNSFALNGEIGYQYNDQRGPNANVSMIGLLLRHHLYHRGRFSFLIDFGVGLSYASERTPEDGTYFNFIQKVGLGATFQIKDNLHLLGGVRFFHMSNARIEGPERNPSINSAQIYLGLLYKL